MAVPTRTCIGCRSARPSTELTRISRVDWGWAVGPGEGRGVWICTGQESCLDEALGRGRLARALRSEVSAADLDAMGRLVRAHWMEGPGAEPLG